MTNPRQVPAIKGQFADALPSDAQVVGIAKRDLHAGEWIQVRLDRWGLSSEAVDFEPHNERLRNQ